ncbi:hypothetical protein AVEN_21969-1 [Araneus ventricosus]|uniref:Mos1 transposase HTH domain-containing protein n=1 Tax=Araneus ventricosus TaxID=182803 RepID=A0A4Y2LD86_ARAVE|nr:hypothetical protein AVEN_21969-1 [Araneus ventricosus]
MSRQAIAKWCSMLQNGRTDIEDAEREGKPSNATNSKIVARVNESILANRRVAVDEIANKLDISHGTTRGLFWIRPRNFEPRSNDEDDNSSPNFHATPTRGRLAPTYDLACNRPHTRRIFSGIGFRTWNPPAPKPKPYHKDTAASRVLLKSFCYVLSSDFFIFFKRGVFNTRAGNGLISRLISLGLLNLAMLKSLEFC